MKSNNKNNYRYASKATITLYLIGDQATHKHAIYQHLDLEPEMQETRELTIAIHPLTETTHIEIYDFPTDKILRPALSLYLKILPRPSMILYFLKHDATHKQIWEWVRLLKENYLDQRIVFVSDAQTYLQREKVISKVGREFEYPVLENICFFKLEPTSFDRLFAEIDTKGIKIVTAVCLKPTLRQKINQTLNSVTCRFIKIWRKLSQKGEQSIV